MIPGLSGHTFEGVFFSEQGVTGVSVLRHCSASSNVQNTHIDKLKRQLVAQAQAVGANAIVNFTYAQRATVFSFSSVTWEATGDAVFIPSPEGTGLGAPNECASCGYALSPSAKFCRGCGSPVS